MLAGGALVAAAAATRPATADAASGTPPTIIPADPRYPELVLGNNLRWAGSPDRILVPRTPAEVVTAVGTAVAENQRIAVRSGGHCYEDFVTDSQVRTLVDLSQMDFVGYDPRARAFVIEPGAKLLDVYQALYKNWGVTIPGGSCYSVGAGGHIAGGGYGLLSRRFGLTVDHLHGVELVTVDETGKAHLVVATRDKNPDLWWAHTGGGGGNFGVVTKYLMRTPGSGGFPPERQLPSPPSHVVVTIATFPWQDLDLEGFSALLRNFGTWHEGNSAPGAPGTALAANMLVRHQSGGTIGLVVQVDADFDYLTGELLEHVSAGSGVTPTVVESRRLTWLHATKYLGTNTPFLTDPTARAKHKAAYMRRTFPDAQLAALYEHLSEPSIANPNAMVVLLGFGGAVNAVDPATTAVAQRDSVLKALYQVFWTDPADDARYLSWVRSIYQTVYASSGGVPVPNSVTDGCYINYPDVDLGDRAHNTSGIPWHDLYYKLNYPRLQAVKAAWDPLNVFRHTQSITNA